MRLALHLAIAKTTTHVNECLFIMSRLPKSERPTSIKAGLTYTFSTFSTFVDLMGWRIARMPGGYNVDLKSFFGKARYLPIFLDSASIACHSAHVIDRLMSRLLGMLASGKCHTVLRTRNTS